MHEEETPVSRYESMLAPNTPNGIKEKITRKGMTEDPSSNVEVMVTPSSKSQNAKMRQKTRPKK